MSVCTVKVSDISPRATLQDIKEFFSFSGDIVYIEIESGNDVSKIAYITFKDPQGAETAQLLTGATIIDRHVDISFAEHYHLPPAASAPAPPKDDNKISGAASAVKKAEDVVSAMLAKGFILGKDVINKAKAFDEKHQLMSTASAKVSSLDKKIGLTEKVSVGASAVSEKVKEADEKYHVSEKTKSAFETAKEKVSSAGSILFRNRFVSAGVSFVYSALSRVTRRGAEIPAAGKENVPEQQEQSRAVEEDFANMHLSDTANSDKSVSVPQEQMKKADAELAEVRLTETPRSQIAPPPAEIAAAQG